MSPDPDDNELRTLARANVASWKITMNEEAQQIIADAFHADERMKAGRQVA